MSESTHRIVVLKKHLTTNQTSDIAPQTMSLGSPVTSHVLDTARGAPAAGLPITISFQSADGSWKQIGQGETNADGRCPALLTQEQFPAGVYKMKFDTGVYFAAIKTKGFYPFVEVVFEIERPLEHYHVPLLLSPYGYSTYRGS